MLLLLLLHAAAVVATAATTTAATAAAALLCKKCANDSIPNYAIVNCGFGLFYHANSSTVNYKSLECIYKCRNECK